MVVKPRRQRGRISGAGRAWPSSPARSRSRRWRRAGAVATAIWVSREAWRGQTGAAVGLPGAEVELEAAVVAVAGVDGPVAAGLALREGVPDGAAAGEVATVGSSLVPTLTIAGTALTLTSAVTTLRADELAVDEAEAGRSRCARRRGPARIDLSSPSNIVGSSRSTTAASTTSRCDLLGGHADVGDDDLVAVGDLGVEARARPCRACRPRSPARLEHVGDGQRGRACASASSLAPILMLDDLGRDDVEGQAAATDRGAAAGGEVGAVEAAADLAQGARDVGGVHPVGVGLAVDGELERAAELDGDARCRRSTGSSTAGATRSLSVTLDALGGKDVADRATDGADLGRSCRRGSGSRPC